MADRPDPRRLRLITGWSASRDGLRTHDGDLSRSAGISTGTPEFPLVEVSRRVAQLPAEEPAPAPPVPPPEENPGLYDLPRLLARIWSVPAAKLASSRAYPATPRAPTGPEPARPRNDSDPPPRHGPATSPWSIGSFGEDSSLPLAAVPSLTLAPFGEPPATAHRPELDGPPAPAPWVLSPDQYIAWRHPPCRRLYDTRPPLGRHCTRGPLSGEAAGGLYAPTRIPTWSRREIMMRPASAAAELEREAHVAAAGE